MRFLRAGMAIATAAALSLPSAPALADSPDAPFDPRTFREWVRDEPTRFFVLGTSHLSGAGESFQTVWLDPLLDRLERFAPAAIAVEVLSGESLHLLSEYDGIYPDLAPMFGRTILQLAQMGQASTGMKMSAAELAARQELADWPPMPSSSDRRRLSALFAASGDPYSALVQWLRLPVAERRAGDGITPEMAERLNRLSTSRNEVVSIAVRLAVRLGLERLYPIDDHSEADLILEAMEEFVASERSPDTAAARARFPAMAFTPMTSAETALLSYREVNSDEAGRRDAEFQWGSRLHVDSHKDMHRRRIASWETRNMRMAGHVREVSGRYPGRRILVVVGHAHKPYLDAYLDLASDAEIVSAAEVL